MSNTSDVNDRGQIPWWDIRNKPAIKRKTKVKKSDSWSSYWMDDDSYDYFYDKDVNKTKVSLTGPAASGRSGRSVTLDLNKAARLAAVRRAVANFVQILTNDSKLDVIFNDGTNSFTDGETVVISAESDPKKFDVLVGTALHESAHCVFSKDLFKLLLNGTLIRRLETEMRGAISCEPQRMQKHFENVKDIINVLEDRRIDTEVYRRAPGYRPYYQKMYDNYWNDKAIAKALISDDTLKEATIQSYMFRVINATNPAIKYTMDALPGLRDIYEKIGLKDILRFSNSDGSVIADDLVTTAIDIYNIILDNVSANQRTSDDVAEDEGDPLGCDKSCGGGSPDGAASSMTEEEIEKAVAKELGGRSLGKQKNIDKLSDSAKTFLDNNLKKKKISKKMAAAVNTMEDSGVTVSNIMIDGVNYAYVRVPRLTQSSLTILPNEIAGYERYGATDLVREGKRLGQIIVDRLRIRHDRNDTKFSRRRLGKIDKRLIHSLGTDNENVFYNKIVQDYKNSIIYLTVDCSSSMSGSKWSNTVKLTTGLAYAATKINNFDIIVNLRYGLGTIWSINMFDSRSEPFSHFERWMARFSPRHTTPESIVYDIEKKFIESLKTNENNTYFITMTDGGANYSPNGYYNGGFSRLTAEAHCRSMMNYFKGCGIGVLSYFIGHRGEKWGTSAFKESYGKGGVFVPLDNFSMISKSINDFLTAPTIR